ncbi:MAG: site-specific tyrosine recombinase XerD [Planctomycetota bacterium]|nr:site-specific tyrosine recombinase XerD [Planctomycetota bacterium]
MTPTEPTASGGWLAAFADCRLAPDLDDFLDALRVEAGVSRNTTEAYRRDLTRFLGHMTERGRAGWNDLGPRDIVAHLAALRATGAAESSVARCLAAVRMLLRHQIGESRLSRDPCALISAPVLARHLPSTLTIDQVEALLSAAAQPTWIDARDRALVEVLYATGARVSEAIGLRTDALEPGLGVLRLFGKGGKARIVPMGGRAAEALGTWLETWRPSLPGARGRPEVFLSRTGRPMDRTAAWRRIKTLALRAGIEAELSPHTLRHSFASHLVSGGADLRAVQEMLGHASIRTTEVYTHLDADQVRSVHRLFHPRG